MVYPPQAHGLRKGDVTDFWSLRLSTHIWFTGSLVLATTKLLAKISLYRIVSLLWSNGQLPLCLQLYTEACTNMILHYDSTSMKSSYFRFPRKGDEHPTYTACGVWHTLPIYRHTTFKFTGMNYEADPYKMQTLHNVYYTVFYCHSWWSWPIPLRWHEALADWTLSACQ